jgi:hypothetical protein
MLRLSDIEQVLDEYVEQFVPAMLRWQYHLTLVKGGPDYPHLSEQSHFAHIVNGVFALTELLKFLVTERVSVAGLDEATVRKALALYTVHEVHKADDYDKLGKSEFSIPLERLREEYDRLGLSEFAAVDEHLMRMANVHKRSSKQGDVLLGEGDGSLLWLLVRLADTFASVKSPEEARSSLMTYLPKLGPAFAPKSPPGKYALYYHEIKDVRGVLTNTIHQAVAQQLQQKSRFYPLLYFATGTLYLGPQVGDFDRAASIGDVVDDVLVALAESGDRVDAIQGGLRRQKFDFESYVYSFASAERLLDTVHNETLLSKPVAKTAIKEIDGLVAKRKELPPEWRDTVEERFGIELSDPKTDKTFNEQWSLVRRYLLYVDTLLRDLNPTQDRLEWFLETFDVPQPAAGNLRTEREIWGRGGIGKYVLVIAYHFLRGPDFADRSAEAQPTEKVLERLHQRVLQAMRQVDTRAGREAAVADLGFRQDLTNYLDENLYLSFAPAVQLETDALVPYTATKRKGHSGKMCSLCNRQSEYVQELRTGILDDFGRVFSNRVLPAVAAPGQNRPWCPVCHLEFIFRKLTGMGLPASAHYKTSRRIYLYVLPTFSFTPEHIRLFKPLLSPFHQVTSLSVRDYGKDWGVPHYWLEQRSFDPDWIERLQEGLEKTADKIAGWGGRSYVGERVSTGRVVGQPHYYLITWEKAARDPEPDDARVATRTEAWAKAIFVATIISGLTSCKIYVTERPYLPVSDPADLKATVTLDSSPPALRGVLGDQTDAVSLYGRERGQCSGLERTLDLSAALWTVTTNLRPNKDKHISGRLERLNVDPLAGAYFYKEYGRENDGQSPYSPLDVACEVLLEIRGGDLMDLVEKVAQKSLEIALPFGASGRGKARRYELLFREGVAAMRKAQKVIPEMRQAALTGKRPASESVAELKRLTAGTLLKGLERRRETRRGEIFVRAWGEELGQRVGEFIDILVDDLYLGRAGGSFARFLRLENSLADGIYYYTDRNLSRLWSEHKQQRAAAQDEAAHIENEEELK